jgi:hypothetical protein
MNHLIFHQNILEQYFNILGNGQVHDYAAFIAKAENEISAVAADILSLVKLTSRRNGCSCSELHNVLVFSRIWWSTRRFFSPLKKSIKKYAGKNHWCYDTDGNRALRMALQTREQHTNVIKQLQISVPLRYYCSWQECILYIMVPKAHNISNKVHALQQHYKCVDTNRVMNKPIQLLL